MEINGFDIEEFNVYGIPSKASSHTCPRCSDTRKKKKDKCMSVFWDTGLGQCNHCGERVQLHTYKKKAGVIEYKRPQPKNISKLSESTLNWFKDHRGISEQTLIKAKVTESLKWMPKAGKEVNAIEFNYFLLSELVNIKSRAKNKDFRFEKDCELIPYNIDSIIGEKECVIVEGEIDALAFIEAGVNNVVSVPNGFTLPRPDGTSTIKTDYLDNYYHVFESKEKIYLAVDNDAPGEEGKKELIRRFGSDKCFIVDFEQYKDANEYLIGEGKESLANRIVLAEQVPLEGFVSIRDIEPALDDFWTNGAPKGFTLDLPGLDDCASFIFKQYTLFVSAPGSGKSDLVDHICARLAVKYGLKSAICSTENLPIHFHYDKIVKKILGYRPSPTSINTEKVKKVKQFVADHYYHFDVDGRFYLQDVLAKFEELVKRKGYRVFVLDPFNKIKLKGFDRRDVNAYTEEYHMLLDEFCKRNDAHIFLVLHPNKLSKREGSDKTFIMPTAYDCKGGGEHYDMSYNILGMVRDYERNMVQIRTLKWKFQHLGVSGVDSWFGWNINNGRYTAPDGYYDESNMEQPSITWRSNSWLDEEEEHFEEEKPLVTASLEDAFDLDNDDTVPF